MTNYQIPFTLIETGVRGIQNKAFSLVLVALEPQNVNHGSFGHNILRWNNVQRYA